MRQSTRSVQFGLLGLVRRSAARRENFNAEVGNDRDAVPLDEVQAGLGDKNDIRPANIEFVENRVDITDKFPKIMSLNVLKKNGSQFSIGIRVVIRD